MGKYLKMADVFVGEYKPKRRIDAWPPSKYGETLIELSGSPAQYAVHAINSHDELVVEVERLTSSLNHANSNHELFERQYYLEKDKCDDMQVEVERLRDMVVRMQAYLDMAGEYPEKESDNPVRQWLFDAIDCTK